MVVRVRVGEAIARGGAEGSLPMRSAWVHGLVLLFLLVQCLWAIMRAEDGTGPSFQRLHLGTEPRPSRLEQLAAASDVLAVIRNELVVGQRVLREGDEAESLLGGGELLCWWLVDAERLEVDKSDVGKVVLYATAQRRCQLGARNERSRGKVLT